jgi:hypothetical protein
MRVKHFKRPFNHTIIYDYFDKNEIDSINKEIKLLKDNGNITKRSVLNRETDSAGFEPNHCVLDTVYEKNRSRSDILGLMQKIYKLYFNEKLGKQNPFLNYIVESNGDSTFLNVYKNGNSFIKHTDNSVLSFVYCFWKEPKEFDGGDFIFTNYDYKPNLKNNSCLIFPSYEMHEVSKIETNDEKIERITINHRLFISSKLV